MSYQELQQKRKELEQKAYSLKTKKAKQKVYAEIHKIVGAILDLLNEEKKQLEGKTFKGVVVSPGDMREFLIRSEELGLVWANPCNAINSKSYYDHTCCVEFTEGSEVTFELYIEVNSDGLNLMPTKITGGTLNESLYQELCKKKLAFFKYPKGLSGLFG